MLIQVLYSYSGDCTLMHLTEDLSACTEVTGFSGFGFLALGTTAAEFLTELESQVSTFVSMVLY